MCVCCKMSWDKYLGKTVADNDSDCVLVGELESSNMNPS